MNNNCPRAREKPVQSTIQKVLPVLLMVPARCLLQSDDAQSISHYPHWQDSTWKMPAAAERTRLSASQQNGWREVFTRECYGELARLSWLPMPQRCPDTAALRRQSPADTAAHGDSARWVGVGARWRNATRVKLHTRVNRVSGVTCQNKSLPTS